MSSNSAKVTGGSLAEIAGIQKDLWEKTQAGVLTVDHWRKFALGENPFAGTLAEVRQSFFQAWFKEISIEAEVPLPMISGTPVSDREFRDRCKKGQKLFFWPGNGIEMYYRIMAKMDQADHWTAQFPKQGEPVDADQIAWDEKAQNPYWFWAEDQSGCPRLKTSWNELMKKFPADAAQHLLSLEEYAIVFFAHREETGDFLDKTSWCWLRTSFGSADALFARCGGSRLLVRRDGCLDCPFGFGGGRLAEIL